MKTRNSPSYDSFSEDKHCSREENPSNTCHAFATLLVGSQMTCSDSHRDHSLQKTPGWQNVGLKKLFELVQTKSQFPDKQLELGVMC